MSRPNSLEQLKPGSKVKHEVKNDLDQWFPERCKATLWWFPKGSGQGDPRAEYWESVIVQPNIGGPCNFKK